MSTTTLTKDNFKTEVMDSTLPVMIDFWASWCGPCRMLSPVIDEIADENPGKVKVCKVNVDDEQELASKFEVFSIPTVVVIKNGKVTATSVGVRPKEVILGLLEQ